GERAAADEEDVRRVDREELLVRVLAAALRRHRRDRSLEDLQERLLDALTRHVARDRRVVRLARDLVDLVDVDDPGLGLLVVEVELGRGRQLLVDDLVAEIDTFVTDVDARTSDQLLDLSLALAAKAAEQLLISVASAGHPVSLYLGSAFSSTCGGSHCR